MKMHSMLGVTFKFVQRVSVSFKEYEEEEKEEEELNVKLHGIELDGAILKINTVYFDEKKLFYVLQIIPSSTYLAETFHLGIALNPRIELNWIIIIIMIRIRELE